MLMSDTFKHEVGFGVDNFQQPKILSPQETVAQIILNLFTMRPGGYPSLPHIGINIRDYLYSLDDAIDVEGLKEKIYTQCSAIMSFVSIGDVQVLVIPNPNDGQSILLIMIPLIGFSDETTLLVGFKQGDTNELLFNYELQQNKVSI
jgi:hypothetical protein